MKHAVEHRPVKQSRWKKGCKFPHPWRQGDLPTRKCPGCGSITLTSKETRALDAERSNVAHAQNLLQIVWIGGDV